MQVQSSSGYVVQDDYSNLESGQTRKSSYSKILYALGCIILIGATVGIVVAVTGGSDDSDSNGGFTHSFRLLDEDAESQAVTLEPGVGSKGPSDQDLYKTQDELVFEYIITNNFDSDKRVAIRDTPLQSGEITTNFVSHLTDVFYGGPNAESGGTFVQTVTIKAGETQVVTMDFEKNLMFEGPGEVGVSIAYTLYVVEGDATELTQDMQHYSVVTDQVELILSLGDSHTLPDPEDSGDDSGRRTLQANLIPTFRRHLGIGVGADNTPYYEVDCMDRPEKTGWTYSGSGNPVPCSALSEKCSESNVKMWCPSVCGGCADIERQYSHPKESKAYRVQMYSGTSKESCQTSVETDGTTKTEEAWIRQAEQEKDKYCSTILWHIQNKGSELQKEFAKWFGTMTDARFERLKDGFTKMCSADRYTYNCNPSAGLASDRCNINFEWGGKMYTNWKQQSLVSNGIKQAFIDKCNSPTKCTFSGTIAWVSSGDVYDRVINLCPVGFWIQDNQQGGDLDSKAAVILHELSHFTDLGDTSDYTYSIDEMLRWAGNGYKDMLDNAASWDNFSEDPEFTGKVWDDFSQLSGGGGAGGNDQVIPTPKPTDSPVDSPTPKPTDSPVDPDPEHNPTPKPTDSPVELPTPKPTDGPAKVTWTVRSSIMGGRCIGNSKSLPDVDGSDDAWIDCARNVLANDAECSHMFYTDNKNCDCVKKGKVCNEFDWDGYNIFVLVPSGSCDDLTWTDIDGSGCSAYEEHDVCKSGAIVGDTHNACSKNSDCKNMGMYADDACCVCGGGRIV